MYFQVAKGRVSKQKSNRGPAGAWAEGFLVVSSFALSEALSDQSDLVLYNFTLGASLGFEDKS
jgi:hypothetical protein